MLSMELPGDSISVFYNILHPCLGGKAGNRESGIVYLGFSGSTQFGPEGTTNLCQGKAALDAANYIITCYHCIRGLNRDLLIH